VLQVVVVVGVTQAPLVHDWLAPQSALVAHTAQKLGTAEVLHFKPPVQSDSVLHEVRHWLSEQAFPEPEATQSASAVH
jgi:hypothetical protein